MLKISELLKATKGRLIQGKQDTPIKGISIDSRKLARGDAFIAIKGNNLDGHDYIKEAISKGAMAVVVHSCQFAVHSDKKVAIIKVKDTTKALGNIAGFLREKFDVPVIAVTGSNGKTTTKEMISWVLAKRFNVLKNEGTKNNHIGLPLSLLNLKASHDIAVLEVGTSHFGEIGYLSGICKPNIGVITNIGPSHLEHLHSLQGVFNEKFTLVEKLNNPYIGVLNTDDNLLKKEVVKKNKKAFILGFGIKERGDFSASGIKYRNEGIEFLINQKYKFTLKTLGYYNIYNALAAISLGRIFGMGFGEISRRLSSFDFPAGRLKLTTLNNIRFLDDTYNSNPASLKQALNTLGDFKVRGRKIFIMGDMLELGSLKEEFHRQAGFQAAQSCDLFLTVGTLSRLSANAAKAKGLDIRHIHSCDNFKEARKILFEEVCPKKEDIVLVKGSRLMRLEEIIKR